MAAESQESGLRNGGRIHRITRVETQKKRDSRVSIYLDGEFAFGLDRQVYLDAGLHEGDVLTESRIAAVLRDEERTRARQKGVSLLTYRPRSIGELRRRLLDKKFSEDAVEWVIGDFIRLGLLDDRQFALSFARTRMIQKPMGRHLLRRELDSHLLSGDLVEAVLTAVYEDRSEFEIARELAERRLPGNDWSALSDLKVKKRISDFLMRRGFDWQLIMEVFQNRP